MKQFLNEVNTIKYRWIVSQSKMITSHNGIKNNLLETSVKKGNLRVWRLWDIRIIKTTGSHFGVTGKGIKNNYLKKGNNF